MRKMNNDILVPNGTALEKNQLILYMEKIASEYAINDNSYKSTYPIPRVVDNYKYITKTYMLLNEHLKLGIGIHPAGEWILDNYYIIEEAIKTIFKEMPLKKYKKFSKIANGPYMGFARIYLLANEIVAYTDNKINPENLKVCLQAYQTHKTLAMEEIWNIQIFLQISIIEKIREICEKIYSSQLQKFKVENIVERLVEKKETKNLIFKYPQSINTKQISHKEMKNPFIEYMSYKLKKYGKQGGPYLNILEEQVNKMGFTVSEIIKKEHFDIAVSKVNVGNCITSIKEILRLNFLELFERINGVEEILRNDPVNIYGKMDFKTKEYYRNRIKDISKKTKISEIYIAKKALELAIKNREIPKKNHIGYYLVSEGYDTLITDLTNKKIIKVDKSAKQYIASVYVATIIISFVFGVLFYLNEKNIVTTIIFSVLAIIPISEIYIQILNYILGKSVEPKLISKMDFIQGVPNEYATIVVIPTIIKDAKRVKELIQKMEVYYWANKSENIYFALLGDASASKNEREDFDEQVSQAGINAVNELNKKYANSAFPKFHFLYRKRFWNASEKCYLGWERKRGLLIELNEFLVNGRNPFLVNTLKENEEIPRIKYVITLDADTNLVLNSGLELIGAMAHPLNKPEIDNNKNIVVSGHGLIQPRVGIDLESAKKSRFTKIFAGMGGTDSYTNAISDIYQDNFEEGIFTGKGIYDLEVFYKVLNNTIPNNTVLSHDLLEGCYLRCGLASDILLMDGYPYKYMAYVSRMHRWIRGDFQISLWLTNYVKNRKGEKKQNPLNALSRFKILDNLRRNIVTIIVMFLLIIAVFKVKNNEFLIWISLITIFIPTILDNLNYIVFRKEPGQGYITAYKSFASRVTNLQGSILRILLELSFLPNKAYKTINAIVKTIYRMKISKQNLLEWTTAEEAEKQAKTDIFSYYKNMISNVIIGLIFVLASNVFLKILGVLWLIGPAIAWYVSKEIYNKKPAEQLNSKEKEYILEVGNKTWSFFRDLINEENNFLPPDNIQEDRREKIARRTSPTNIGLGMLAVISAYDLKYIDLKQCIDLLENMINTINKLTKWNGHLYNWYNTETLEPLFPRYISSVDSGNFIGYLYIVKQFLEENLLDDRIIILKNFVESFINKTDFSVLFDNKKRLFSIGFNIEENKLTDSYYDLLASEARQASFVAIAKKDITSKHWNNLSRTLTSLNGYKGLISWSGTAFEYLMPNINMKMHSGSLLDESCKFMIMSQREYAKKLGIIWGISESAYNLRDLNFNYQYKAFGIPWLGLKRGLADEMVVSSYGLILAIVYEPKEVIKNLKILENEGMYNKYGFYEAIDFTTARLKYGQKNALIKTYMAHHQGLILISINNLINSEVMNNRFNKNPEIEAIDILLQERMPDKAIITKEKKEKVEKIKAKDYETYTERIFTKLDEKIQRSNVISNGNYTICNKLNGTGFSKWRNIYINKFKQTEDYSQGILFYIKNIRTNKVYANTVLNEFEKPDRYVTSFAPDRTKYVRIDGNIETTTYVTVSPSDAVEIRRLEIKNNGWNDETLEITSAFEPVLSLKEQDYAHPAFNNLFLTFEYIDELNSVLIQRKKREQNQNEVYLGSIFNTEHETIGDFEYEIDKEKFFGRENIGIPQAVIESKPLGKRLGLVTDSVVAMKRTIKIKAKEKVYLDFVISISNNKQEVIDLISKYKNQNEVSKLIELAKAKAEAEAIYLTTTGKEIELYQNILTYLIFENPLKKLQIGEVPKEVFSQSELWKYGISGDVPILLVKIQDANDIYVVSEVLKAYEYLKIKDININIVILNEEINSYEQYVKDAVYSEILNKQLDYLQNSEIYVINSSEVSKRDIDLLDVTANLIINAQKGSIATQLKELEDEYINIENNIAEEFFSYIEEAETAEIDNAQNLKYNNEYGGFSESGEEYNIKINKNKKLPTVWSHIMANEKFGTLVTQNLGGYTWSENCRLNRLTVWNNNQVLDIPSEIIYLKDKINGNIWSFNNSLNKKNIDMNVTYGFGYAKYKMMYNGILQELQVFVPKNDATKINIIKLNNTTASKKEISIIYYLKIAMAEDELKSLGFIDVRKDGNMVYAKKVYSNEFKNDILYATSSEIINSFTGNKNKFIGLKTLEIPKGVTNVNLDNKSGFGEKPCVAFEIKVQLDPYENKEISLVFGKEESIINTKDMSYKYSKISNCTEELKKIKQYWNGLLNTIKVKTPIESINIMLNGWSIYQTITSRLWAKTGYYQSGGAIGFRDQLQDTLALKYLDIEFMKKQIIRHCEHQFLEGDVEHWWHEETKRGIRTKFSDDLLWLCYSVAEYLEATSDYEFLDVKVPYLSGELLSEDIDERYDIYEKSDISGSIYEHCIKSIEKSLNFGENGIPKIGSGDWNDGLNTVGNKGKGESVWLGFFLYDILNKFIPICKVKGDEEKTARYEDINLKLKKSLNSICWDGRWFKRAFTDNGETLGSIENEECRIDSISQSWGVISKAADNDKKYIALESLENHLIDKENGIIKLLDPPFNKGKIEPGYIKAYLPGVRENGGQYTHAAVWVIIALTYLGFGDKAEEYYKMINPIEHARTREMAQKYKVEPYVISADIYGANNLVGRGGWTWYTGSSSWFYKAGVENILGFKIRSGYIFLEPCISSKWEEYTIQYKYKTSVYNIKVKNPQKRNCGQIDKMIINGVEEEEKRIKLLDNGQIYEIEVII